MEYLIIALFGALVLVMGGTDTVSAFDLELRATADAYLSNAKVIRFNPAALRAGVKTDAEGQVLFRMYIAFDVPEGLEIKTALLTLDCLDTRPMGTADATGSYTIRQIQEDWDESYFQAQPYNAYDARPAAGEAEVEVVIEAPVVRGGGGPPRSFDVTALMKGAGSKHGFEIVPSEALIKESRTSIFAFTSRKHPSGRGPLLQLTLR